MRSSASPCNVTAGAEVASIGAKPDQQRPSQPSNWWIRMLSTKTRVSAGQDQAGQHQHQADPGDEANGRAVALQAMPQARHQARDGTARHEVGAGLEAQDDAGETLAEFLAGDGARPDRGIVELDLGPRDAFDHQEVIEVPVDDEREGTGQGLVGLAAEAVGLEAVARAARTMLPALLPSRDTPQATRSSSSGTRRPR